MTSLLLADPRSGQRWLFDATPDLRDQLVGLPGAPPEVAVEGGRPPLFEAVFLTHAHIGHYLGLAWLGREAYGVRGQRVRCSPRMAEFLSANGPWSQLVDDGALELAPLRPGETVELADGLSVEALSVPHRDEYSDTLAFLVRGPRRALLFVPDIDKWERWELDVEALLAGVDVALLDGTFYAAGEVPGRDMAEIPHPLVVETLARFASLPDAERAKVRFIHLNHTNPLADPQSRAAAVVRAAGLGVARERELFEL